MSELYPVPAKEYLLDQYVGKCLQDLPVPAAILDLAVIEMNCTNMLDVCQKLGLGWRAHVKTHKILPFEATLMTCKTVVLTKLMLGDYPVPGTTTKSAKIIVSTVAELEFLVPLFEEYKAEGRDINILYGLPLGKSLLPRLIKAAKRLGTASISFLIDHPAQVPLLASFHRDSGVLPLIFIKIDMGAHRSGVQLNTPEFQAVASSILDAQANGSCRLAGLYSHAGHSYSGSTPIEALSMLADEFESLLTAANTINTISPTPLALDLSVGASPTALSLHSLHSSSFSPTTPPNPTATRLSTIWTKTRRQGHTPELHAGVYPVLDLQQLSTHSVPTHTFHSLSLTILTEIHSIYPTRNPTNSTPEALIGAGVLALAREPCKAYAGLAKVTPWNRFGRDGKPVAWPEGSIEEEGKVGWEVARFSQEHGILQWKGEVGGMDELEYGQRLRLWCNHACITASHFPWFFVVDSREDGEVVKDIWIKARGW